MSSFIFSFGIYPAEAAVVTATGTNATICNQTVSDATSVVAYRLSGGDCVIEFRNVGSLNWTAPSNAPAIQVLVVAGGGGGGARHAGGGAGGGVLYVTNYKTLANSSYGVVVGDGGAGAPGLSVSGGGRAGANSSFAGTSGTGSIVTNGGGGGGGGNDAANGLNFDGTTNATPSRGSGGGSNFDTSPAGAAAPGTASDSARAVGATSMTVNAVTATVNAYGQSGAVGKGNAICYGSSTSYTGWCGGGGGGSATAGASPTQPGAVNPWKAGKGGDGVSIAITGTGTAYAGGGGGASGSDVNTIATNALCVTNSPLPGDGGAGGGGAGGACLNTATSGSANTGGGGGGGGLAYITGNSNTQGVGGKGGSGIVILRYAPDTTTSLGALTLSGASYKGITQSLSVTVNTPGRVRFFMDGKRIPNCISVATTGTAPNFTATCNWKPSTSNRHVLTATFTPTDPTYSSASPVPNTLFILRRTTTR
jgi:hypothetical protein